MRFHTAQAVVRHRFGDDAASTTTYIGAGAWSECFAFMAADRELVVRVGKHREDFEHDLLASSWRSPALPIPEVLEVGDVEDLSFAISTRVHGTPIEHASTEEWQALLPQVLAMFDAMRAIDVSDRGFGSIGRDGNGQYERWADFLTDLPDTPNQRHHGWRAMIDASPALRTTFDRGFGRLTELVAELPPITPHLVHVDLIHRNVLVEDGRIQGVFDWGCARYGDTLYDIAYLTHWSSWYTGLAGIDLVGPARARFEAAGTSPDEFDLRMRTILLRIGLSGLAYAVWDQQDAADIERIATEIDLVTNSPTRSMQSVTDELRSL